MKWGKRRNCPHVDVRGIYGDEINHTPGFRRLQCRDCGRYLDGPVTIAYARAALRDLGRQIVASNRSAQEWDR